MAKPTWNEQKQRWQVISPAIGDQPRQRKYFVSKADAMDFAAGIRGLRDTALTKIVQLDATIRSRLMRCLELAGGIDALESAVTALTSSKAKLEKSIKDATKDCVALKDGKKSWQYVENLEVALKAFSKGREERMLSSVTSDEIQEWLDDSEWSASTQQTYLRRLETLFNFGIAKGWCVSNPTETVELPEADTGTICIMPVDQCRRLLDTCRRVDPGLLPYFTIALFAGLRPEEVKRLTKEQVRDGWIHADQRKGRSRRRRLVEIHPTLAAWLKVDGGEYGWTNWRRRWREVRDATAISEFGPMQPVKWGPDILRHSFASYAYPIKGAVWTANECGHSERILFQKYRELVPESTALAFWQIFP